MLKRSSISNFMSIAPRESIPRSDLSSDFDVILPSGLFATNETISNTSVCVGWRMGVSLINRLTDVKLKILALLSYV